METLQERLECHFSLCAESTSIAIESSMPGFWAALIRYSINLFSTLTAFHKQMAEEIFQNEKLGEKIFNLQFSIEDISFGIPE